MRKALAAALFVAVVPLLASPAGAAFSDVSPDITQVIGSGSLSPPTAPATAHGPCDVLLGPKVTITWSVTPSTWASGYEVGQSLVSGGPYTTLYSAAGQATTSFTTPALTFSTTYYFVVKAAKDSWRSAATAQVSRTTKGVLCV